MVFILSFQGVLVLSFIVFLPIIVIPEKKSYI